MTTAEEIQEALMGLATKEKQEVFPKFFKTGKGEYGEGDRFIGVSVPDVRRVAKACKDVPMSVVGELLNSPLHEMRTCALVILVNQCKRYVPEDIYRFYLAHTHRINNWDLVDISAPNIVGGYLLNRSHQPLYLLAESEWLWDNRIAIVATLQFIRQNDLDTTFDLALKLIHHPHDLMHKATGWMLREAGKKDAERLYDFVEDHRLQMPRTMLRYAIEKFDGPTRKHLMRKE